MTSLVEVLYRTFEVNHALLLHARTSIPSVHLFCVIELLCLRLLRLWTFALVLGRVFLFLVVHGGYLITHTTISGYGAFINEPNIATTWGCILFYVLVSGFVQRSWQHYINVLVTLNVPDSSFVCVNIFCQNFRNWLSTADISESHRHFHSRSLLSYCDQPNVHAPVACLENKNI